MEVPSSEGQDDLQIPREVTVQIIHDPSMLAAAGGQLVTSLGSAVFSTDEPGMVAQTLLNIGQGDIDKKILEVDQSLEQLGSGDGEGSLTCNEEEAKMMLIKQEQEENNTFVDMDEKQKVAEDIRIQMRELCNQLADVGEECYLVSVREEDGNIEHLGSIKGDHYCLLRQEMLHDFKDFCLGIESRDKPDDDAEDDEVDICNLDEDDNIKQGTPEIEEEEEDNEEEKMETDSPEVEEVTARPNSAIVPKVIVLKKDSEGKKVTNKPTRSKHRQWSPDAMTNAYKMVTEQGVAVSKAAKIHGVPLTTLRDRIDNRVSVDCYKSGPSTTLTIEEETRFINHLKELESVGYSYCKFDITYMASNYAVSLGKKKPDELFTSKWFYNFVKRWPVLKTMKTINLLAKKSKCASKECVSNYFKKLEELLSRYNLKLQDKPQNVYIVDEFTIKTVCEPSKVVSDETSETEAAIKTVTIIGAGNAAGYKIPPFFVFPDNMSPKDRTSVKKPSVSVGKPSKRQFNKMLDSLLVGKSEGADGVLSMSGSSDGVVFKQYLQKHFVNFCLKREVDETILVLYDGHVSHVSVDLVDWAKEHNIMLFVLPPHTSKMLQPKYYGCIGPFQTEYAKECDKFSKVNRRNVKLSDVCSVACIVYSTALNPYNLKSRFERTGLYPFQEINSLTGKLDSGKVSSTGTENVRFIYSSSRQDDEQCSQNVQDDSGLHSVGSEQMVGKGQTKKRIIGDDKDVKPSGLDIIKKMKIIYTQNTNLRYHLVHPLSCNNYFFAY